MRPVRQVLSRESLGGFEPLEWPEVETGGSRPPLFS